MTPEFARAVDPVFLRVLNLLERIGRDEELSADNERRDILGYLDQAEGHLGQRREWELAKYALVSWIDEVLIEAPWRHRGWWKENTLEWEKFKSGECSEQFFVRAKEAHSLSPPRDALEVFYICVVLGFRGLYRDPVAAAALAQPLGLPADLETWARQVARAIPQPSRGEIREENVPIEGAAPLDGPFMLIWSVFVAMILAAVTGVLAWWFYGRG
jgi:type VI secretion system protein ImpK